jgi:hypothetical protein
VGTASGSIEIFKTLGDGGARAAITSGSILWVHTFYEHTHPVTKIVWNICSAGGLYIRYMLVTFIVFQSAETDFAADWLASSSKDTVRDARGVICIVA